MPFFRDATRGLIRPGVALWALLLACSTVNGHGIPIHVSVAEGRLVVSGGVPGGDGFAANMFVEQGEDGDPFGSVTLPGVGPVIIWQIPGFEIHGMDPQSDLSMDILLRPVANRMPQDYRTLWYWNDQTEQVEPAGPTSALHLLARDNRSVTLAPDDHVAPPPLLLAESMTGHLGFHHHGLLSYALANAPAPPSGVFGFFARLSSTEYEASDPFLVLLNHGTDYSQMVPAASAINRAAFLSGDYNRDGVVDAVDYTIWRNSLDSTDLLAADGDGSGHIDQHDYLAWRQNYGATDFAYLTRAPLSHAVPAPGTVQLLAWGVLLGSWRWFRPRSFLRGAGSSP